jgi:hypothetical protein
MSKTNFRLIWTSVAIIILVGSTAVGYEYGSHRTTSSVTPQVLIGKFMGLGIGGNELAFQPLGAPNGQSYAWNDSEIWYSAKGVEHVGGAVPCLTKSSAGKPITLAVITVRPVQHEFGTTEIIWLQCHS